LPAPPVRVKPSRSCFTGIDPEDGTGAKDFQ
jgi:hypothetical protein